MADQFAANEFIEEEDESPAIKRRAIQDSVDLDITPMIDIVFLLLIFFVVASVPDVQSAADLPPARHAEGVNPRAAVVLTIINSRGESQPAEVYLGDGKVGSPLPHDHAKQEEFIRRAVEEGYDQGKSGVLLKAEKGVLHREVARVKTAAARARGINQIKFSYAVHEVK